MTDTTKELGEYWRYILDGIKDLEKEASCDHYEHITLEKLHNNRPIAKAKKEITAALSVLQRIASGDDWFPIESAPRDGEIVCFDAEWSESGVTLAENYGEWWQVVDREDDTTHFTPTHWKPLDGKQHIEMLLKEGDFSYD